MKREDKPIRYEAHAHKRLKMRGITEDQVKATIRKPTSSGKARRKGALKLTKKLSPKRSITVIIEEEARFIRVVAAYKN